MGYRTRTAVSKRLNHNLRQAHTRAARSSN